MEALKMDVNLLRDAFGDRLQTGVPLARFTSARVGGPADALLEAASADELAQIAGRLWQMKMPFNVLGSGSNVLVSDKGLRGVIILNRASQVRFEHEAVPPAVWAESGANLGALARRVAVIGLSGLEWASSIPGTMGGAVVGNAGAHGSDMAATLLVADILHLLPVDGTAQASRASIREEWSVEQFEYAYRTSRLKRNPHQAVVLAARLKLSRSTPEAVQTKVNEISAIRRRTQPPGASMGSMFKNPPGDHAGRMIDAAGLKGKRIGEAEISPMHANFFINRGKARAEDIFALLKLTHQTVAEKFGVNLELEIELLGDWDRAGL